MTTILRRSYEDTIPTNPRFADKVEWKDSVMGFRTSANFGPDCGFWLVQECDGADIIFVSDEDAIKLAIEIINRFKLQWKT